MNRLLHALHLRWPRVGRRITSQHRNVALLQPANTSGVQAGAFGHRPRSLFYAARPPAGADEHHVALLHAHAALLLPGIQILGINYVGWFEVWLALQLRNVDQHATREDAGARRFNRQLGGALAGYFLRRKAVVEFAVIREVAQCIHVRVDDSVVRHLERIGEDLRPGRFR